MSNPPFNPIEFMKKRWQSDGGTSSGEANYQTRTSSGTGDFGQYTKQVFEDQQFNITKKQLEEMLRHQQQSADKVRSREQVRITYNSIIWKRLAKHHLAEDVGRNVSAGGRLTAVWRPEIDGAIDPMTKECPFTTAAIETGGLDFVVTIDEDGTGVLVSWHEGVSTVVENTIYRGMDLDSFLDEIVDERLKLRKHFAKELEAENEIILGALEDLSNV